MCFLLRLVKVLFDLTSVWLYSYPSHHFFLTALYFSCHKYYVVVLLKIPHCFIHPLLCIILLIWLFEILCPELYIANYKLLSIHLRKLSFSRKALVISLHVFFARAPAHVPLLVVLSVLPLSSPSVMYNPSYGW